MGDDIQPSRGAYDGLSSASASKPVTHRSNKSDGEKKQMAADALGEAEKYADALDQQGQLREELRMEQEENQALHEELEKAQAKYDELAGELAKVKERNSDLDIRENERSTVLEAKGKLEEDLSILKAEHAEAERVKAKAEQDLTFEQEVRRAAAASRDEAEKLLAEEKRRNTEAQNELQATKEQLAAADEARRLAEEAAAKDRDALLRREDDVMALRIELGEKEAEVRHVSKIENLRSELEWKTRMLTSECEELEGRLEESEGRRRKMEQAVMEVNSEMRLRRKEGEAMKRMLEDVVSRTDGARSTEDSKLRELSAVRESVNALKEEANRQLAALDNMRKVQLFDFEQPQPIRRRRGRYDEQHTNEYEQNPRPPPQRSPQRNGNHRGFGQEIFESAELDSQIKQIEDELTIKLPPLGGAPTQESPNRNKREIPGQARNAAVMRGQGQQARGAGAKRDNKRR